MITKDFIVQHFLNSQHKIIAQRCLKKYLIKYNLYNDLINYYNDSDSIHETIYRIIYNIDNKPICKMCGKPVKFTNGEFPTYCCPKCRNNDPDVIAKNKAGVSKSLKEAYQIRGNEIKNKRKQTLKERYGVEVNTPFGIKEVQDKIKITNIARYGVENVFSLNENRSNRQYWQAHSVELQKEYGYDIEYIIDENNETKILVKNGCIKHGNITISLGLFNNRTKPERRSYTILCPICNPVKNPETSIESTIKNILNELNVKYIQHDRVQIKPYELDFYLPDYNIGIECNGIFWHSGDENAKRLLHKYELCKKHNIRLINLWENDIHNKTNIIYTYLKKILNKENEKILSVNCIIKEINELDAKKFIKENSLLPFKENSINIGLFYNNNLIQIAQFEQNYNGIYALFDICSLGDFNIINGERKILEYFNNVYKPIQIIGYSLNDLFDGKLYENLGFEFIEDLPQKYWYINRCMEQVEYEDDKNIFKCYDTGCKKYILTNKFE